MPTTERRTTLPGGVTASIKVRKDTPNSRDAWLELRRRGHWYVVLEMRTYRSTEFTATTREFGLHHGESA